MAQPFEQYQATYDFDGENDNELSFKEGDIIQVYNKTGDWWEGQLSNGKYGVFPANRVAEYTPPPVVQRTYVAPQATVASDTTDRTSIANNRASTANNRASTANNRASTANNRTSTAAPVPIAAPVPAASPISPTSSTYSPRTSQAPLEQKVAADLNGGESKQDLMSPAAPKSNGADLLKSDLSKPITNSKFGVWASNMGIISGYFAMICGIADLIWGAEDSDFGMTYVTIGILSLAIGAVTVGYEEYFGQSRKGSKIPFRGLTYAALSVPQFFSTPSAFSGVFYVCTALVNFASAYNGEEYDAPKQQESQVADNNKSIEGQDMFDRVKIWILVKQRQNRIGVIVFLFAYAAANIAIFFDAYSIWQQKNNSFAPDQKLSSWVPWAKAFGYTLDFNCAIIVLPVLRSCIRWLYNASTANEGLFARCLRGILYFIPLDKSILFHRIIAKMIVVGAIGHAVCHLINYALKPSPTMDKYGVWPWVSGGIIFVCMLFMYAAAFDNVKRHHFEIFWYSHHLFIPFFFFLLLHGAGGFGPNYWKWFLGPGTLYVIERLLRVYRAHLDVVLLSVTNMKPDVFSLEFAKEGVLSSPYKEGQYLFICCPSISDIQWHPFTISSAPQEKTVTVHIKKMPKGSWTAEVADYVARMGPPKSYFQLSRQDERGAIAGKILGPDGKPLFQIDGPHSAPTQHVSEYHTAMIIGSGIGVTPVSSTLKSVVLYRWRFSLGHSYPDNAYFFWVCNYNDVDAFRWLIRVIKDCEDEIYDMRAKNANDMNQKRFAMHIFVTSVPKGQQPVAVQVDDDIGFWGVPREDRHLDKVRAPFDEMAIYQTMKCPAKHTQLGDIHIYEGRPKWDEHFNSISDAHPRDNIGVAFCGNPIIGRDLKQMCFKYSSVEKERYFKLHKENF